MAKYKIKFKRTGSSVYSGNKIFKKGKTFNVVRSLAPSDVRMIRRTQGRSVQGTKILSVRRR